MDKNNGNYAEDILKLSRNILDYGDKNKIDVINIDEGLSEEKKFIFIDNLTANTVFISWSDKNNNEIDYKRLLISKLKEKNYVPWESITKEIKQNLPKQIENFLVIKKNKFANIDSSYFIQEISTDNSSHKNNLKIAGLSGVPLQKSFIRLKETIKERVSGNKATSILRASDGDYFFLRRIAIGSAKPGQRALTTTYNKIDIGLFRNLFWQNDLITLNLEKHEHKNWMKFIVVDFVEKIISKIIRRPIKPLRNGKLAYILDKLLTPITLGGIVPLLSAYIYSFKKKDLYFKKAKDIIYNKVIPSESVYALVSTRWVFRNFKNQIGIIASENKSSLIKELMKSKKYQEYLGTDLFIDYFTVPEKGAADDILNLSKKIGKEINKSSAKIFLVGTGSSKIALIPLLKSYSNAVFIDVGCGIDAIAGIVCQERPYFAEWTNYRIKNYDYSKIDFMDQGNPAWNKIDYKTTYIE